MVLMPPSDVKANDLGVKSPNVVYQVYPRSFRDASGDGSGDIPGIIEKLDYLADLGVDAIWFSPFFKSPQVDQGYDISAFCDIAPEHGTMADFDLLLNEMHAGKVKYPTASCGALREREPPHRVGNGAAFLPPASWGVSSGNFYENDTGLCVVSYVH